MDPVTAVRSQVPQPASPSQPALDRPTSAPAARTAPAVAETMRRDAVLQPAATAAMVTARLAEHAEGDHPADKARAAAEAAREAYIRASVAAGLNPLPLPGG
jgi:hypothetical protein